MSQVLCFDYGAKRTGVAVGHSVTGTASALTTLTSAKNGPDWTAIGKLIAEWTPDRLVVGLPLQMDGSDNDITPRVRRFIRQLEGRFGIPVSPWEERLTSREANTQFRQLRLSGGARRKDAERLDAAAARLILEDWLAANSR